MDNPACQVIYVHENVTHDGLVDPKADPSLNYLQDERIRNEVLPLLDAFGDVYVCSSGIACLDILLRLHDRSMLDMKPTIILLDTPHQSLTPKPLASSRPHSPTSDVSSCAEIHTPDNALYGLNLLQKIITEAHLRNMTKLIVPIPMISNSSNEQGSAVGQRMTDGTYEHATAPSDALATNRDIIRKCVDLGAVDVIVSPLNSRCIATLEICAYRAHRDAAREQQALLGIKRGRQRSWVGINEEKPFAYLREAMVSGLMKGICRLGPDDDPIASVHVAVSTQRQAEIGTAIGDWHFSAHAYTDDELVVAAMLIFKHALTMPALERWRIPTEQLISFLVACRAAYNNFVPYHNFRHVVDVLQATFHFLVRIGALAPYPVRKQLWTEATPAKSPMASLLSAFEALTLLITAIGHDVGHPGVNNGFLITLNAPLAQLYNDRSVLESFHCAAYSQILRRYWPAAFEDSKMRNLMISSILATDMGLHFDYMKRLGDTQEKLQENNSTDGWNGRQIEEQKALACSLLIKCADISNVARRHDAALQWMHILSEEFSRQASMESELEIQSSLMAPPKQDMASLAKAQLSFMNLFAIPLFQGVADIMPAMNYTVEELEINKGLFEGKVTEEKAKVPADDPAQKKLLKEGTFSPRTMSFAVGMEETLKEPAALNNAKLSTTLGDLIEEGVTPTALLNSQDFDKALDPPPSRPTMKPAHIPRINDDGYKEVNGKVGPFTHADPFGPPEQSNGGPSAQGRGRSSQTTEGSASGGVTGDWTSQATSAATGKMPRSPSTKGTSIISKNSGERPTSAPGFVSHRSTPESARTFRAGNQDSMSSLGSLGKAEGKTLKKKPSRFRMKDFPFFRRHKASSPSAQGTDTAG